MPYVLRFDEANRLATATFSGAITGAEITASFSALQAWLATHPGPLRTLWDMREATSLFETPAELERSAEALRRTGALAPGRGAFVVREGQVLIAGLGKVLLKMGDSGTRERRAFTDYAEALAWVTAG